MWGTQKIIEDKAEEKLATDFADGRGKTIFGYYLAARDKIISEIAPEIKAREPGLTDHGPEHIEDVLTRVGLLLGETMDDMSGTNLYLLIVSILFHDVGNVYGREDHNQVVGPIYDQVRIPSNPPSLEQLQERLLVLKICRAHSGKGEDKSNNTLRFLDKTEPLFNNEPAKVQEIAAILRFADELSEGEQRTSSFALQDNFYDDATKVYHQYALFSKVTIDRELKRIALTYIIPISKKKPEKPGKLTTADLSQFLPFVYHRILKLDQERRYARHYARKYLEPYERTTITIKFVDEENNEIAGVSDGNGATNLELTDLVVPGDIEKSFIQHYPSYDPKSIIKQLNKRLRRSSQHKPTVFEKLFGGDK